MANTNAPYGFRQYRGTGSSPTYEQVVYTCAYDAGAIYFGDPVISDGNGGIIQGTSSAASANAAIYGIFVGCQYLSVAQKRTVWSNYWPGSDVAASQSVICYVVNDPNAQFVAQSDATGIAATSIGKNVGYTIGTGNTANGISGAYLNSARVGTDSSQPFRIVGLVTDPPGSAGTIGNGQAYDWVIVAFNNVNTRLSVTGATGATGPTGPTGPTGA